MPYDKESIQPASWMLLSHLRSLQIVSVWLEVYSHAVTRSQMLIPLPYVDYVPRSFARMVGSHAISGGIEVRVMTCKVFQSRSHIYRSGI